MTSVAAYRLYDSERRLLYVGTTTDPSRRLREHTARSWSESIATVTLEWYQDLVGASEAEMRAIKSEKPIHNVLGNDPREDRRALRNDAWHGTRTGYQRGCRCDDCRQANTLSGQAYRRRRGIPTRSETNALRRSRQHHGTVNMYDNLGCRCESCRNAASAYRSALRASKPKGFCPTAKMRFLCKITIRPNGCCEWIGAKNADGYGVFGGSLAHRYSYETFVGPIPEGLTLDHLCSNPPCINPHHLEPVTNEENVRRAWAAGFYCNMWAKRRSNQ